MALGNNIGLGSVMVSLDKIDVPRQMVFEVMLKGTYDLDGRKEEVRSRNHWDFWVYPQTTLDDLACMDAGGGHITDTLDKQAEKEVLKAGRQRCWWRQPEDYLWKGHRATVRPCFGNELVQINPPHTTGKHPSKQPSALPELPHGLLQRHAVVGLGEPQTSHAVYGISD